MEDQKIEDLSNFEDSVSFVAVYKVKAKDERRNFLKSQNFTDQEISEILGEV